MSMLSNLAETLHSSAKLKNKQVAKIWNLANHVKKEKKYQNAWFIDLKT